ncbi:MAG: TonB family protein [Bacteroidetes bacterium]|nr:TonB family protein [Bacteroidota bacterium]
MTNYLLEVTLCWAVFYGIYHLLLRSETFHCTNRWYLLATLLLGLAIPALDIDLSAAEASPAYLLQPITVGMKEFEAIVITASQREKSIDFQAVAFWTYCLGVMLALVRFGFGLSQISKLYRRSEVTPSSGYRFVETSAPHLPFSFFNNLFWSKNFVTTEEERHSIVRHEEAHIFQKHSHDVVLLELVAAFAWCVPFVYFYKKAVKTTHEYLADAHVTAGFDKKQYGRLLLRQSHPGMQVAISNSLFSSQLKKRIVMMTKTESSKRASWKYLALLPAMALLCLAFSFAEKADTNNLALDNQLLEPESNFVLTDTVPTGDEVYQTVEEMPRFPGCEDVTDAAERNNCSQSKLLEFLFSGVKFPKEAQEKGFGGLVVAKFVVDKDGSIYDVDILRGGEAGTGEEVKRVIRSMPKWVPGKKDGKPVRTEFKLPVRFELDGSTSEKVSDKLLTIKDLDEMPEMMGCESLPTDERKKCSETKLIETIYGNIKYPAKARDKGVEGMVVAKFVIEKDGSISSPEIVKSVGSGCDEEVLRVIKEMPDWSPGKKDGKAVAVSFTLPVMFKLDAGNKTNLPNADSKADSPNLVAFKIFPNPASDNLTLAYDIKTPAVLHISDAAGKEIGHYPLKATNGTEEFSTSMKDFPKGMLYLTLLDSSGKLLGTRVLMQD